LTLQRARQSHRHASDGAFDATQDIAAAIQGFLAATQRFSAAAQPIVTAAIDNLSRLKAFLPRRIL
jgi:hypothetical protein